MKKVLAVSSGGGHWIQLLRLQSAFGGCEVIYASVNDSYQKDVTECQYYTIKDATQWDRFGIIKLAFQILWILLKERPDVIITTGAAPGFLSIVLGKLIRAKSVWVDSIANAEVISLSGKKVGKFADLWLTQWEHLAKPNGPYFQGSVL